MGNEATVGFLSKETFTFQALRSLSIISMKDE